MIMKVFAVYDSKACHFGPPFFDRTVGSAVRGFEDACNNEKSELCKFPSDYTLFEIGEYDDVKGEFGKEFGHKRNLGMAASFKKLVPVVKVDKPVVFEPAASDVKN